MKISEKWLRSFIQINRPIQEIAEILTMRGLEVEEIAPVAGKLNNIVVAEILSAAQHPNADRLRVCQVNDGTETLTIVCGAPNARAGIKVALAKIGAVLPGVTIKKSKIRDVESHGMLCSVSELGLAEKSEGIMELSEDAPIGKLLVEYLDLDDNVLDISITPNRGDCASVLGIAREVAAIEGGVVVGTTGGRSSQTQIADQTGQPPAAPTRVHRDGAVLEICPIYLTQRIHDINPAILSPIWLKEKLRRSGVRSINVPVDVTNYVMFECGQPMHAFDAQKIQGAITIRLAKINETLELLNDTKITLDEQSLIIADEEGPIALAGIMGGKRTAVSETTTEILLESAHFSPENIARTARHFNLNSDSSYRFERGVDPGLSLLALEQATQMIIEIAGGNAIGQLQGIAPASASSMKKIALRYAKLEKVIGASFSETQVTKIFSDLQMSFEKNSEGLLVTIPSYRFDLIIEEDLIEEVLRIHGCDNIEAVAPRPSLSLQSSLTAMTNIDTERLLLKTLGYDEIISYSFVDEKLQNQLAPDQTAIRLKNPISQEMSVMRTTLWTGLISTLQYNLRRQQTRVRLFEQGLCFNDDGSQPKKLSGLSYGGVYPESWNNAKELSHFFDVKNEVVALLVENKIAEDYDFLPSKHPALHPTQSAQLVHKQTKAVLGDIGVLHPQLVQAFDLPMVPVLFELDVQVLRQTQLRQSYVPVAKFPEVRRDLSFLVPTNVIYQDIVNSVQNLDNNLIQRLFIFDVYQGKGIPEGYRSLAVALIIQDFSKTLIDDEVALLVKKVIDLMENQFKATLRD
ncbi:MAG: phenylalanine--tRNA ligase subunit beta [Pseudomonadota bacterium]